MQTQVKQNKLKTPEQREKIRKSLKDLLKDKQIKEVFVRLKDKWWTKISLKKLVKN